MKQKVEYFQINHRLCERWRSIVGREIGTEHSLMVSCLEQDPEWIERLVERLNREQISLDDFVENFTDYGL